MTVKFNASWGEKNDDNNLPDLGCYCRVGCVAYVVVEKILMFRKQDTATYECDCEQVIVVIVGGETLVEVQTVDHGPAQEGWRIVGSHTLEECKTKIEESNDS